MCCKHNICCNNVRYCGQISRLYNHCQLRHLICPLLQGSIQVLCFRTIFLRILSTFEWIFICRAQILCVETREFFKTSQGTDLTASERFQFLNLWYFSFFNPKKGLLKKSCPHLFISRYIVICVNDVFLIIGSVLKELIELRETR